MILRSFPENIFYSKTDIERRKNTGRSHPQEARDAFEKDYGRIIHSSVFRRLQAKTQVHSSQAGDFHRTRLTHSMEVAQIARGIVIHLNAQHPRLGKDRALDTSLVEAAALAHDLGHPPFGHHGEKALHQCMKAYGGFEGNAQTFRILTRLEGDKRYGLNLTRGLLLSVLKYPMILNDAQEGDERVPPKASVYEDDQEAFQWVLSPFSMEEKAFLTQTRQQAGQHKKTLHRSLECSIIDLADDLAYGTHDFEDAINLGFISVDELLELLAPYRHEIAEFDKVKSSAFSRHTLKKVFADVISLLIRDVRMVENPISADSPRVQYRVELSAPLRQLLDQLKEIVMQKVILTQTVQTMAYKGKYVVRQLFEAMMHEPRLLSRSDWLVVQQGVSEKQLARIVADYVSGMTDSFAMKMYKKLFGNDFIQ